MTETAAHDRDIATWVGLGVVGLAAATMSFTALSDLAFLCGIKALIAGRLPVSWLLPVTVDVLAAVATRVWLQARAATEAVRFARWAAWAAIGTTVVGNAAHGALVRSATPPPWLAGPLVSAIPAVAVGAIVHLAVLVGRPGEALPPVPARQAPGLLDGLTDQLIGADYDEAMRSWRERRGGEREAREATGSLGRELNLPEPPSRDEPDDVLVADLRVVDASCREAGKPTLKIDGVRARYGVGATRGARLRREADEPPASLPGGRPHLVPPAEREEATG